MHHQIAVKSLFDYRISQGHNCLFSFIFRWLAVTARGVPSHVLRSRLGTRWPLCHRPGPLPLPAAAAPHSPTLWSRWRTSRWDSGQFSLARAETSLVVIQKLLLCVQLDSCGLCSCKSTGFSRRLGKEEWGKTRSLWFCREAASTVF